jgi:hypothetical protein
VACLDLQLALLTLHLCIESALLCCLFSEAAAWPMGCSCSRRNRNIVHSSTQNLSTAGASSCTHSTETAACPLLSPPPLHVPASEAAGAGILLCTDSSSEDVDQDHGPRRTVPHSAVARPRATHALSPTDHWGRLLRVLFLLRAAQLRFHVFGRRLQLLQAPFRRSLRRLD